ncbi:NAD(P)H-flavin reductase [Thaumasiovibrio sp. DFM-14]|uniref:NAD(P)H-flavin reductase n=1 Tax=Thaumasiovibrio sp. DFM-14 TaxID=3384792 RepID=UPI0039A382FD
MTIECKVKAVVPLAPHTYKVVLQPPKPMAFKAGQYIQVCLSEQDQRPFSIANRPGDPDIELHIGAADANPWALQVVEYATTQKANDGGVAISLPQGEAYLRESSVRPIVLVAGGTGFTYVRSILLQLLQRPRTEPIFVYWGARDFAQLYADAEMQALAQQHSHLSYVPIVEQATAAWSGKVGNVLDVVSDDFISLEAYDIYLCGRFEMAGAARERFSAEKGAQIAHMYADAFSFI